MSITSSNLINKTKDRVRLPLDFDVAKMQAEVNNLNNSNFIYYDAIPLRSPAHLVDASIPFPPPAEDYADGSWTPWMDTPIMKKCPYISSIVDTFREKTTVNLVRLLRLAPNAIVKEHVDPTLGIHIEKSMVRLTIPIQTNDQVEFYLNDEVVPMKQGECWYLRLSDPHRVINNGLTERINLAIDVIPNDWVRSMILNK